MNVVLATQSPLKVKVVEQFYTDHEFGFHADLLGTAVERGTIPKVRTLATTTKFVQPLGRAEAALCLRQRLSQAAEHADADTVLLLALENFIETVDGGGYRDACYLAVRRPYYANTRFARSTDAFSVPLPHALDDVVTTAFATAAPMERTCGELLGEIPEVARDPRFSPQDWFLAAGSSFDRATQLRSLLDTAAQWLLRPVHGEPPASDVMTIKSL